ncbi:MAG: hypothetical protein SCARUB_02553 [Candidatus Scalindua rubra]|uniref:Uncharacterized protein n=1 Tax=Candidatus Scalindua rubra TaxID=1872076 RepID=A0A1E3X9I5_9BACT|nr:MAG: hypothetical protein SCARUB_02553 [Candidatus Scalindua rubra]
MVTIPDEIIEKIRKFLSLVKEEGIRLDKVILFVRKGEAK